MLPPLTHPLFPTQVLRHDIGDKKTVGTVSEAYPHLIFDNFTSKLGVRVSNILKHLFPVPKPDTKRVLTFANQVERRCDRRGNVCLSKN